VGGVGEGGEGFAWAVCRGLVDGYIHSIDALIAESHGWQASIYAGMGM
jgi:hypothetical protein